MCSRPLPTCLFQVFSPTGKGEYESTFADSLLRLIFRLQTPSPRLDSIGLQTFGELGVVRVFLRFLGEKNMKKYTLHCCPRIWVLLTLTHKPGVVGPDPQAETEEQNEPSLDLNFSSATPLQSGSTLAVLLQPLLCLIPVSPLEALSQLYDCTEKKLTSSRVGEGVGGGVKAQVDDCKSNLFSELAIKEGAGFKVASKQVLSVRQEEGVDVEEALLLATLRLST